MITAAAPSVLRDHREKIFPRIEIISFLGSELGFPFSIIITGPGGTGKQAIQKQIALLEETLGKFSGRSLD